MDIHILTLFPDMFKGPLSESIVKRAVDMNKVRFHIIDIRSFTQDKHHTTDLRPFGGGPGMVMMVEPIHRALLSIHAQKDTPRSKIILLSAKGKAYQQSIAKEYSLLDSLVLICGHYEGVDERVATHLIDEELRIGEYVLTGGELPAMVVADSVVRLLPQVLGDDESAQDESHKTSGYLEYPHYTRPSRYQGWEVPQVLLNGDHAQIEAWRKQQSTSNTEYDR